MSTVQERNKLLVALEKRKKEYSLLSSSLQEHQAGVIPAIKTLYRGLPSNKYILFQGGNGAGKSFVGFYITTLLALGDLCHKYKLPYIGNKKRIRVVTKSSSNIEGVVLPYLMGDGSGTRIPPECIDRYNKKDGVITLTNGNKIYLKTYDQGRERLQGGNPDFLLVDEEPVKDGVWNEILARAREKKAQMLLVMTPLSGHTPVYKYFYEQESEAVRKRSKIFLVSSLENKYADNTALLGLTEQERKMRIYGQFVPPSGLVYPNFYKEKHVINPVNPWDMGNVRFYGAIDFGMTHPTAFLLIAVDDDGNIYVFDMIYKSNMLIKDLAREMKMKMDGYPVEFIIADSAGKRERTELRQYGVITRPAKKNKKGENNESNRRAGINKINQLLHDGKIFISNELKELVNEFQTHSYSETGDGQVNKINDDALDALRYFIFEYKPPKVVTVAEKRFKKKYGIEYNKIKNYNKNNPY